MSFIITLFSSGFLAALIAAIVSFRKNERKLSLQYITGERAKWRDKIREKALEVFEASKKQEPETIKKCYFEFSHLLHLGDPLDDEILEAIKSLESKPDDNEKLNEFRIRVSLLLKYEWDRAKAEANPIILHKPLEKLTAKLFRSNTVERLTFEKFKEKG